MSNSKYMFEQRAGGVISLFLKIILCAVAITVLDGSAQAQPPFATTKVDGTENIYIFRYGGAQAMFVVTKEGMIATDPIGYGRPQAVTTYLQEIKKVTNQPVRYVIYSHHHFDDWLPVGSLRRAA